MLNKPIEEIIMENGKVIGVKSEGEVSSFYNLKNAVVLWRKFPNMYLNLVWTSVLDFRLYVLSLWQVGIHNE